VQRLGRLEPGTFRLQTVGSTAALGPPFCLNLVGFVYFSLKSLVVTGHGRYLVYVCMLTEMASDAAS